MPPTSVAESVNASPSTSPKVPSGISTSIALSSSTRWLASGTNTLGASLAASIIKLKFDVTLSAPSLAVILSDSVPLKLTGGVPIRYAPSKLSQMGNGSLFESVAARAKISPSTSPNVDIGTAMLTRLSSADLTVPSGAITTGASFTASMVKRNVSLVDSVPSDAVTTISSAPL